jgi:hypothetical protein
LRAFKNLILADEVEYGQIKIHVTSGLEYENKGKRNNNND